MTPGPVDDYLRRLARELRQRGLDEARIVAEAREHLVDAVEDGRQRGLSVEEAEREAFERFGAPETVAAHGAPERDRMMGRFAVVLETVWHRKWWILAPTVLAAVVTSVASYYLVPTRYRSESVIRIMSPRVPGESARLPPTDGARARFLSQTALSGPRLERIIRDFGPYQVEQKRPLDELVVQLRQDIDVTFLTSDQAQGDDVGGFNVSFVSSDPKTAQKITDRLAALIIEANFQESEREAERRYTGEQFRLMNPARLPERPVGPSRLGVNLVGSFAGLGLGLACVGVRGRSRKTSG
jgi:hypothetical protein